MAPPIYTCGECGTDLGLSAANLFPPDFYFEAGNKGTLSFTAIAETKLRFEKENKFRPFFETVDYWGIHRNRTKIKCDHCGRLVGHVYDDGPLMTDGPGQFHFGPSQVVPRWTKSKYAHLNQPEIKSSNAQKPLTSTYVPSCFNFNTSTPLHPTSLGVF